MAYDALVSLEQTIGQVLNDDSDSISSHQKQQIASINTNVTLLRAFLEDFPKRAESLEGRMRDLANQVENIMENFMWRTINYRYINWSIAKAKLKSELKKVAVQIDSMAREVSDVIKEVHIGGDDDDSRAATSSSGLAPAHGKDAMVGFDDDLLAIKEQLCGESSKLQVIPIVGMGGIGKTTLATNAYNDPLITEHFQIRAWVTVSEDYSAQKVLSDLLASIKELNTERSGQSNELNVYQSLKGWRYLIVLDDIWSTKAWDDIKMIFPDDNIGSRIMLTTRLAGVATYADHSSHLHEMHLMDMDHSWDLLLRKVFAHDGCPPELEDIGKEIARSCGGLPLAIAVIAGLLCTVGKSPVSWKGIAGNVKSAIATKDGQFEKILSLSYTHLPHHLRPCFLYMGAFPEDYEINVSKLIKLWIAEGFIKPSVSRSFEEEAGECLEDLVKRSLVMVSNTKSDGKIKSCRLHDVIRDLCIRKAQQEKFLLHVTDRNVPKKSIKNERRLCIYRYDLDRLENIHGSTTRTMITGLLDSASSQGYLGYSTFLRVLDVVYATATFSHYREAATLPAQVFELFRLRYLAFGYPIKIPKGISNLRNLQTLIIRPRTTIWDQSCMVSLPVEIWRMPLLRHLVCNYFGELPNPEEGANFSLENLHTLSAVTDVVCKESILKMIPNVKKLGIFYSEVKDCEDFQLHNLVHLQQLEKLKITVDPFRAFRWKKVGNPTFPSTLRKLTLNGWGFPRRDTMTIVGSLPNLQVLKLRDFACDGDIWETNEGEFPELRFLLIEKSGFRYWITESSHFPSLKWLLLHQCWCLNEIPDGIGEIPTLELIEVKNCPKRLEESAKRIQEKQQDYGNDAFEVRSVRCTLLEINC